jgi:hypothetical protein
MSLEEMGLPPLSPTELGVGGGDCWGAKQNKIRGKIAICSFDIWRAHRHLSIFCLKQKM